MTRRVDIAIKKAREAMGRFNSNPDMATKSAIANLIWAVEILAGDPPPEEDADDEG